MEDLAPQIVRQRLLIEAFVPLIDSGIALYIWTNQKFLSCVLYTCKQFSVDDALEFTKQYFNASKLVHREF